MILNRRKQHSKTIQITPKYGNYLYDITSLIELIVERSKFKNGLVNVHVQASTAAIMIQENGDTTARKDIMRFLQKLIPTGTCEHYKVNYNGEAHIKASLIGPGKTIPITKGKLDLSKCQKIFLCEFDRPGKARNILIKTIKG